MKKKFFVNSKNFQPKSKQIKKGAILLAPLNVTENVIYFLPPPLPLPPLRFWLPVPLHVPGP